MLDSEGHSKSKKVKTVKIILLATIPETKEAKRIFIKTKFALRTKFVFRKTFSAKVIKLSKFAENERTKRKGGILKTNMKEQGGGLKIGNFVGTYFFIPPSPVYLRNELCSQKAILIS